MEEARAVNRIEVNLTQEKIDFLNASYTEEIDYWKRTALGSKNKEERKQLGNLAPLKIFWLVNVLERVELKIFMKCLFI